MVEKIKEIILAINPAADFSKPLVDGGGMDSFAILQLISELSDAFDVEISPVDIVPENFGSVEAIAALVTRLTEGD